MKCPKCHSENPADSTYCSKCAAPLSSSKVKPISVTKTLEMPTKELSIGSIFAGRYQIIEEIGRGGMGRVYKVLDKDVEEKVALKLLNPEIAADEKIIKRFRNELKFARKITHKNVCRMFDLNEEEGMPYITMEYVPGEDLKSSVRRMGQLTIGKAISVAKQICEGLDEAHRLGVVHRDMKPQNIMIDSEGNAHIMDFGIARSLSAEGITDVGVIIGTPEYMSPEQVGGEDVDQRSDLYSLGIILYEIVSGRVPFQADSAFAVGMKHKSEKLQAPQTMNPQIPDSLNRLILKCLEKEKERRFQTAEEILSELKVIKESITTTQKITGELESITAPLARETKEKSIAVLPFSDLSPQKDQEYFCDGLAEELINSLTHINELRVPARSSSFSFKGKDLDIREVGKALNVETVLEGSVRKAGNRLRITAQLINVADGYHMWSERYDRDMDDIFAIQDEISLAIVDNLKVKLLKGEKTKIVKRHTEDKEAYNLYLKGRYFWNRRHEGDMMKAIECYQQALEKDSFYSLPYVGIADVFNVLGLWSFIDPKEAFSKAKAAVSKALELDDSLGDAYTSLGFINMCFEWKWAEAEKNYKRGIELNPKNAYAHAWYSIYLIGQKRHDEAVEESQEALELEPLSPLMNAILGLVVGIGIGGDTVKGREQLHKALEMEPNLPMGHLWVGQIYLMAPDDYGKAIIHFQKATQLGMTFALGWLGWALALSGKMNKAAKILDQLDEIANQRYISPFQKALVFLGLEKSDEAFEYLELAYKQREPFLAFFFLVWVPGSVRSDPRYIAILKKIGLDKVTPLDSSQ
ncbi:MAG: protein kinase [Candidatus Aminicenantes bacterium]|nr:protein kinase [Candidatus Aminicenantes bacterium]